MHWPLLKLLSQLRVFLTLQKQQLDSLDHIHDMCQCSEAVTPPAKYEFDIQQVISLKIDEKLGTKGTELEKLTS